MKEQRALKTKARRRAGAVPPANRVRKHNLNGGMRKRRRPPAPWGIAASIDIYRCNPATIRDAEKIRRFVVELCELIRMKRFGETSVIHFGEDERVAGFSMVQLIETSLISAHFANRTNTTYLDVFSCKPYDVAAVEEFSLRYFGGKRCITHVNRRL